MTPYNGIHHGVTNEIIPITTRWITMKYTASNHHATFIYKFNCRKITVWSNYDAVKNKSNSSNHITILRSRPSAMIKPIALPHVYDVQEELWQQNKNTLNTEKSYPSPHLGDKFRNNSRTTSGCTRATITRGVCYGVCVWRERESTIRREGSYGVRACVLGIEVNVNMVWVSDIDMCFGIWACHILT